MNGYLYNVANHTSIVLRLFAYSSTLEEAASRRANAAGIRNTLEAWAAGEPAPESMTMVTDASAPPLTPWENWHYRVGRLGKELDNEREAIAILDAMTVSENESTDKRMTLLEQNVKMLEQSAMREGPHGSIRVAYTNFAKDLVAIRKSIDDGPGEETKSFVEGLANLEADATRVRDQQLAFLNTRRSQTESRLQNDTGPLVSLVLTAGKRQQLDDARDELASVEAASGEANQKLRALIDDLQTERAAADADTLPKLDRNLEFRFSVVPDCGALPSMAIFVSAMLAFPTRWWKRFAGIAVGIPLLYVINVVRLVCLGMIGAYDNGGDIFDFAHHYVWQGIYIVFVVAIWMAWVEFLVKPGQRVQRAPAK
jgi:exosortase/archaeosortase family protein